MVAVHVRRVGERAQKERNVTDERRWLERRSTPEAYALHNVACLVKAVHLAIGARRSSSSGNRQMGRDERIGTREEEAS